MLQYLILQLCDTSVSYCHYDNPRTEPRLMPLDVLKKAILWSMKENLTVQVLHPDYALPNEYNEVLNQIDHTNIVSSHSPLKDDAEVVVVSDWNDLPLITYHQEAVYVLRTSKDLLTERYVELEDLLGRVNRLNLVITDVESFTDADFVTYKKVLKYLSQVLEKQYANGNQVQFNLLTDRMMLDKMNNCGAGDTNITLAPDGEFYVCPAFYASCVGSLGNISEGIDIKNPQLYKLDHAPLCRKCDAYQCKRCIWLNRKTTFEVNIPSHEQCVLAHLERNASRGLLAAFHRQGLFSPKVGEIKELDYLDPFDLVEQ